MDLIYVCRPLANEELRYSIRSAVKNLEFDNIWVIGGKPDWYKGNFLEVSDIGNKYKNINNCLKVAIDEDKISNDFVFMNDDFYITKEIKEVPVLHGGSLSKKIEEYQELSRGSIYTRTMNKTYQYLLKAGYKYPIDYDIHVPMNMDKDGIEKALKTGCQPRSIYGNFSNVGGTEISDVKVYRFGPLAQRSFDYENSDFSMISTQDDSFAILKETLLDKLFTSKSEYEKD
jgi:hypothetical protein